MSNEASGQSSSGAVVGLIVVGVLALAGAGVGVMSYVRTGQLQAKLTKAETKITELEKRVKQVAGPGKGAAAAATPTRKKKRPATTQSATAPASKPAATPGTK